MSSESLQLSDFFYNQNLNWNSGNEPVSYSAEDLRQSLLSLNTPCFITEQDNQIGITHSVKPASGSERNILAYLPAYDFKHLGDSEFRHDHGTQYSYYAGAMANGIASEKMVIALGKAGFMGSFGSGGLVPSKIEEAIIHIQKELPHGPYAFNFIHSPSEPALEKKASELYLKYHVTCVEAAAFIALTLPIVHYRIAGLKRGNDGSIIIGNRIIAKISRKEVATRFMEPAPEKLIQKLLNEGLISQDQAVMAQYVPMADDITAEADSGGHTDNRPLVSLLPSIIALRNDIQKKYSYPKIIRVGAGGGIGTPESALAAFSMGAAYIVTGSVNQACVESGSCMHTKTLLASADMADVTMAPASDMFEMGVRLQVLKRGSFFAMRANKLYTLYRNYTSIEDLPEEERTKLETQVFRKNLDEIWDETLLFFKERDPSILEKALHDPRKKMALIFRWYLGLASRWSNTGEKGREMDYQIWCGPSMGAFNAWTKNCYLSEIKNRKVVDVAIHLMRGAAYLHRIRNLQSQGIDVSADLQTYNPVNLTS